MASSTLSSAASLEIKVIVGKGVNRGNFIFHTDQDLSNVSSQNSTIRAENLETRLSPFSDRVQSLVVNLLAVPEINGVDVGPCGVRLHCEPHTAAGDIYYSVKGLLCGFFTGSGEIRKQAA